MRKLYKLKSNANMIYKSEVISFLAPNSIYIPTQNKDDSIKLEKKVAINQEITTYNNTAYYSSISGKVNSFVEKRINANKAKCIEIINDYKEKKFKTQKKEKNHENLLSYLTSILDSNTVNKIKNDKPKFILFNCINDALYVTNHYEYLNKYCDELIDTLHYMQKELKCKIFITIKTTDVEKINRFISKVNQYINMQKILFENEYLIGNDFFQCERLNIDIKKTIQIKPYDLYKLYSLSNYNKMPDTKHITVTNCITNTSQNYNVKLYTSINEFFDATNIKYKNKKIISNSLLNGTKINPKDEIFTESINALFIIKSEHVKERECINCGKCYEVCPIKINVKESIENKTTNNNCIDCGLCSYYCPSRINLRKILKGDHHD